MLDRSIERRLEGLRDLPAVPLVISQVLKALDNPNMRANTLAKLIERDQTLTSKVLKVANSAFYGFSRRISTIDLAIIIMGLNSIKEIVIGLVVQRFLSKINKNLLDVNVFWQYSLFCGACSRVLARKMGYKLAGEAFVAGLMHDLGILILLQYFTKEFRQISILQEEEKFSLIEAEQIVLNCTHAEIGAWLAKKWNLPENLCQAIEHHHTPFYKFNDLEPVNEGISEIRQPLTAIVSMAEWMADEIGYKSWSNANRKSELYLGAEIFDDFNSSDIMDGKSAFQILKQEIIEEYERASEFQLERSTNLYK